MKLAMSEKTHTDFDDKLAELSNWQIQQQKKLRAFKEAQRRLLDLEHQNILSTLRTQNLGQKKNVLQEGNFCELGDNFENENGKDLQRQKDLCQLKYEPIKLDEPKSILFNVENFCRNENGINSCESVEDHEKISHQPRKFLRRGEGLARFRMTPEDFRGPPKIYKERKIKTYLNNKPECSNRSSKNNNKVSKVVKKCIQNKNSMPSVNTAKSASVPVKIYIPEKKTSSCNSGKSTTKQGKDVKKNNVMIPLAPSPSLILKPHSIATEWYNVMKEKEKVNSLNENCMEEKTTESENCVEKKTTETEVESRKDEKELKIFEILEQKVDESSFCSTSSYIDKLMEQSLTSTPSKYNLGKKSYEQGLKSLRSQFLGEEHIKKFEEFCNEQIEESTDTEEEEDDDDVLDKDVMEKKKSEFERGGSLEDNEGVEKAQTADAESHKVNKTLLEEYIKDFKKFKNVLAENAHRIEEEEEPEVDLMKDQPVPSLPRREHDVAVKLRQKGLQDNVKQLLNWESAPRKRPIKRVVKKIKSRPVRSDKSKNQEKNENEKIIFNSTLLRTRLDELEKEIAIFRKENKNLEKLQRECVEERQKLARERKEFEKQMQEDKEKWDAKVLEDQKKLQKERTVFEKYCKQVKNQPSRQEREELATLKKELEKLSETLATKEARWGASQARLRNQLKSLEKDNAQLKVENDKLKKLSLKKVSFESDRNLNTKIIHAINSELGKLKPAIVRSGGKNQSLSARVERREDVKNPIRRIKSAPNMKKSVEENRCREVVEFEQKALGSVSTDSGIDTNGSQCPRVSKGTWVKGDPPKVSPLHSLGRKSPECSASDCIESVVCEAVFGKCGGGTGKILETNNLLKRLTLDNSPEEASDRVPAKMVEIPVASSCSYRNNESEDIGESSFDDDDDDDDDDDEEDIVEIKSDIGKRTSHLKNDSYMYGGQALIESRLEESGVREKVFEDGSKEISYPNGNVKKLFPGNKIVKMIYYNGDIKETNVVEGSEKYYYAETKTWHTTYLDGLEVLEFPNGQTERRYADGSTEISFPNGCVRYCDSSGRDEWRFLDGTVIKTNESGHKILLMPNGQKEIHTNEYKRREYPDGTVKILYADGTQETRYASGRVRLKDKEGNLVMDSGGIR